MAQSAFAADTAKGSKTRVGKKGYALVASRDPKWLPKVKALRAHWFYTWGWSKPPQTPKGIQFVPMMWGYYGNNDGKAAKALDGLQAATGTDILLGFNEPDGKDQANLSVDGALEAWPLLMHSGMILGSPAAVHPDGDWMQAFMKGVEAKKYRVDFVTIHWYGGADPQGFLGMLDRVHALYHRPVWVTEFAPADWSRKHQVSPQQAADFMKIVIPGMNRRAYVERYAWYSASENDTALGQSALFHKDGSLTPLGTLYASLP